MKKYFLQPSWDLIPREYDIEFIPLQSGESFRAPISLANCELLRRGASLRELKTIPHFSELLQRDIVAKEEMTNPSSPPKDYLELLQQTVIGPGRILHQIGECPTSNFEDISLNYSLGFGAKFIPHQSSLSEGWGADPDPLLAKIKAAVEGVERYALSSYDRQAFSHHSFDPATALTPEQLGSSEQVLMSAGNLDWTTLQEVNGPKTIEAPLDFLHHPVDYTELDRFPIAALNISGIAGHQSLAAAQVNALLELCEHEALMVAWHSERTTPAITHDSIDPLCQNYISQVEAMGWQIIIKDISLDLVPVVMVIGLGPTEKRALTIGSCAAFSSKYAIKKALTEVVRTILIDEATTPAFPLIQPEEVQDIAGHGLYYARPEHLSEASHLWSGVDFIAASDQLTHENRTLTEAATAWAKSGSLEKGELNYLTENVFKPAGIEIYFRDITPAGITIPLFIVHTIAPEMARLAVGYGRLPAQTKRLKGFLETSHRVVPSVHPFS